MNRILLYIFREGRWRVQCCTAGWLLYWMVQESLCVQVPSSPRTSLLHQHHVFISKFIINQLRILTFCPFCPIFASIIVISLILSMLGTLLYAKYSVAVDGNFSAEPRFKKYWKLTKKSTKNRWKIKPTQINLIWKKYLTRIF